MITAKELVTALRYPKVKDDADIAAQRLIDEILEAAAVVAEPATGCGCQACDGRKEAAIHIRALKGGAK